MLVLIGCYNFIDTQYNALFISLGRNWLLRKDYKLTGPLLAVKEFHWMKDEKKLIRDDSFFLNRLDQFCSTFEWIGWSLQNFILYWQRLKFRGSKHRLRWYDDFNYVLKKKLHNCMPFLQALYNWKSTSMLSEEDSINELQESRNN